MVKPHSTEADSDWRSALDSVGRYISISSYSDVEGEEIAYIDLSTRQVFVNFKKVNEMDVGDCLEAIFSHELMHHASVPSTIPNAIKLQARVNKIIEDIDRSKIQHGPMLLNLIYDFIINTSREMDHLEDQFCKIYRNMMRDSKGENTVFGFTLMMYEEVFNKEILSVDQMEKVFERHKNAHKDAEKLVFKFRESNTFNMIDEYVKTILKYFPDDEDSMSDQTGSLENNIGETDGVKNPSTEDIMKSIKKTEKEKEANRNSPSRSIRRDQKEEDREEEERRESSESVDEERDMEQEDKVSELSKTMDSLQFNSDKKREIISEYYDKIAQDRYIQSKTIDYEKYIPSISEPWEFGDSFRDIDWMESLSKHGVIIPGVTALKRDFIEDDTPIKGRRYFPWVEIYIDCSGSMPDPRRTFSPLVLAGFIIANSALAVGSKVRVIHYSHETIEMDGFTSRKSIIHKALVDYVSGGTEFPFDVLKESVEDNKVMDGIERVVITDGDFIDNMKENAEDYRDSIIRATSGVNGFSVIMNKSNAYGNISMKTIIEAAREYKKEYNMDVYPIEDWSKIGDMASWLGREVFGDD